MNTPISQLDPIHRDESPDPVSGDNVQIEQNLMQDETGDLAGAIGLVTLLERSGYVVRRRRSKACWKLRIRGHGESWYATGKTTVEALEAAVRRMVPCEIGRVLLRDAIAENGRNAPSARAARDALGGDQALSIEPRRTSS
jgi:HAMP domain-containing protein